MSARSTGTRALNRSPRRVQRQRAKGWRAPAEAVYVGRGSRWGNPYAIGDTRVRKDGAPLTRQEAVALYAQSWVEAGPEHREVARAALAGRDLMCWCRPDQICHADVLLEVVNG